MWITFGKSWYLWYPHWLFPIAVFSFVSPETTSKWTLSKIFPRTKVRLTDLQSLDYPFCALLDDQCKIYLFPIIKDTPISTTFQIRQRAVSASWDADQLVPWTCLASICPTLLKLFQLQATSESRRHALHPAHGYILHTLVYTTVCDPVLSQVS